MSNVENFLEHFGTKGMKWGVRNQKRLVRAKRVASGKASTKEKIVYNFTDKGFGVGFTKAQRAKRATKRVDDLEQVKKTMMRGEAGVKDVLKLHGRQAFSVVNVARIVTTGVVAMSQDTGDFLEHYGVKGQKWGVRRELKRIGRADQRFEKLSTDKKLRMKLVEQARDNSHEDLEKLKEQWSSKAYDTAGPKLMPTDYYSEAYKILNTHLDTLSREYTNSSGTKRLKAQYAIDPETGVDYFVVRTEDLQHAAGNEVKLSVEKDENGMITDIDFPEELFDLLDESLEQDAMPDVESFLEHHGIKGMKWGVRNKRSQRAFASRVINDDDFDTEGKEVQKIISKARKHGTVSLTNHELRTINARQKLEQEFAKANPKEKGKLDKGHEQVQRYLKMGMTAKSAYDLFNSPAGKALRNRGNKDATKRLTGQAFLLGFK